MKYQLCDTRLKSKSMHCGNNTLGLIAVRHFCGKFQTMEENKKRKLNSWNMCIFFVADLERLNIII